MHKRLSKSHKKLNHMIIVGTMSLLSKGIYAKHIMKAVAMGVKGVGMTDKYECQKMNRRGSVNQNFRNLIEQRQKMFYFRTSWTTKFPIV